jgi:hypothetical protein
MNITKTALLACAALTLGTTASAATIDTHAFTFSTGDTNLSLLSETANTAQIRIDNLAWSLSSTDIGSGGSSPYSMFDAVVKDGYRIVSFTLSATLTGALDVAPLDPACGQSWTSCQLGSATNRAELRWVTTDGAAEATAGRQDFAGQAVLSASNAQPLSLTGAFNFVTESTLYVSAADGWISQHGSDWDTTEYFPSMASIGFASPVVLTVQVAAVPEPATYAMLFAGLGLLGWAARRKGADPA